MVRSSTLLFFALLVATSSVVAQTDPDALYRERANVDRAREAVGIWEARLKADTREIAEGLEELRKVIAATPDAEFEPEDRELQQKAAEELARRTKGKK